MLTPYVFQVKFDTIFKAGIDTTGTTATFLLHDLASDQGRQEKLYQEISREVGPHAEP